MSSIIKKLFGTLLEKPWEESQALIDNKHVGKTFGVTNQMSAVIIIFGISTAIFSLIFTAYLYSIPPEQFLQHLLFYSIQYLISVSYTHLRAHET